VEKLCFIMPSDPEIYLAAIAALQAYFEEYSKQDATRRFVVTAVTPSNLEFLLNALPVPCNTLEPDATLCCSDFDLVFEFNVEAAYKLSVKTEKHITQAFGLMLGTDAKSLPDLSPLVKIEQAFGDVDEVIDAPLYVVYDLPLLTQAVVQLEVQQKLHPLELRRNCMSKDAHARFCSVLRAPMVIGECSFETYVAAALGKTTVEFYPSYLHRRWLSKWSARSYQMIYGLDNVTPDRVLTALRTACRRLALAVSRPAAVEMPTAQ
jgi:hypothetical protein